jgi:membrane-bound metal-dependent hydrolase YbcI (DUF457 family)
MRRTTHLLSGIAVGALVTSFLGRESYDLLVIGAAFGVFPDFDIIFSGLSRKMHRSPATHSILASCVMAIAWTVLLMSADSLWVLNALDDVSVLASSVTVFAASFVHAVEDSLTLQGCRTLFPLSGRVYKGPVRYDDLATNAALGVIAIVLIVVSFQIDLSSLP